MRLQTFSARLRDKGERLLNGDITQHTTGETASLIVGHLTEVIEVPDAITPATHPNTYVVIDNFEQLHIAATDLYTLAANNLCTPLTKPQLEWIRGNIANLLQNRSANVLLSAFFDARKRLEGWVSGPFILESTQLTALMNSYCRNEATADERIALCVAMYMQFYLDATFTSHHRALLSGYRGSVKGDYEQESLQDALVRYGDEDLIQLPEYDQWMLARMRPLFDTIPFEADQGELAIALINALSSDEKIRKGYFGLAQRLLAGIIKPKDAWGAQLEAATPIALLIGYDALLFEAISIYADRAKRVAKPDRKRTQPGWELPWEVSERAPRMIKLINMMQNLLRTVNENRHGIQKSALNIVSTQLFFALHRLFQQDKAFEKYLKENNADAVLALFNSHIRKGQPKDVFHTGK